MNAYVPRKPNRGDIIEAEEYGKLIDLAALGARSSGVEAISDATGFHVRKTGTKLAMARLKITGSYPRGGCYQALIFREPGTVEVDFGTSGALLDTDIGQNTTQYVVLINLAEIGHDTHDLTDVAAWSAYCWGIQSPIRSADKKPVYETLIYNQNECEPPPE